MRTNDGALLESASVCSLLSRLLAQCVSAPSSSASLIQIDAYKKLVLVQLLAYGKVRLHSYLLQCTCSQILPCADPSSPPLHLTGRPHRRQDALRTVPRVLQCVRELEQGKGRSGEGEGQGGVREGALAVASSLRSAVLHELCGPLVEHVRGLTLPSGSGLQLWPRGLLRRVPPPPPDPEPHRDVHHALARTDRFVRRARCDERARSRDRQGRSRGNGELASCLDGIARTAVSSRRRCKR